MQTFRTRNLMIQSREDLIHWALRALGSPVVQINVTEEQLEDRLDDSLELFQEFNLEANERTYLRYQITAEDIYNQWIPIDGSRIIGITKLIPASHLFMGRLDDSFSQLPFDIFYQMMSSGGFGNGGFAPIDLTSYVMFRQYATTIDLLLNTKHDIRYKRYSNKLFIDCNWGPKEYTESNILTETPDGEVLNENDNPTDQENFNIQFESELTGNTTGRPDMREGDFIILECHQLLDPEEARGIYNDRFLKELYKANVKKQWATNLRKFSNMTLPGGVAIDAAGMLQEADTELQALRQELQDFYTEPLGFVIG